MRRVTRRRTLLLLALALPSLLIIMDTAYGQRRGGGPMPGPVIIRPNPVPRPVFVPPQPPPPVLVPGPRQVMITVWSCSRCGAELGRGGPQPAFANCPSCGVNLVNNLANQAQIQGPPVQAPMADDSLDSALYAVAIVFGLLLIAGGIVLIVILRSHRASIDLRNFERLAVAEFEEVLPRHGFVLESAQRARYHCEIIYGNGERYVWISARAPGREKLAYFSVLLGEGDRDFRSRTANAVALWELRVSLDHELKHEYVLRNDGRVRDVLQRASDDLISYDGGFLSGQTEKFLHARRRLSSAKEAIPWVEIVDDQEIGPAADGTRIKPGRTRS